MHGHLPSYDAFRAPTPHPLVTLFGLVLSPLGDGIDRAYSIALVASYVALVAGVYRLARVCFTPLVGWLAALLLLTRLDFASLAVRGFVDAPYLAFVVWAAALEAGRPRRGGAVWALLALAGLLRPEAWGLALLYAVWMGWPAPWRDRLRYVALAAVAPVLWVTSDLVVTGDPLWSLTYTHAQAGALSRSLPAGEVPRAIARYLYRLTKPPAFALGLAGLALAVAVARRRAAMPALLLALGVAQYLVIGLAGFSAISRYLLVAAVALLVFAAFALGGFSVLAGRRALRRAWAAGAAVLAVAAVAYTAVHLPASRVNYDITRRTNVRLQLGRVLGAPAARAARRCGPVSVPNYKLVPDVRWVLDAAPREVVDRSDPRNRARARYGVAIFVLGRELLKDAAYNPYDRPEDGALIQVPGPGFTRVASNGYFVVYVRCARS